MPGREFPATNGPIARSVPDFMARLEEAEIRARIKQARVQAGLRQPDLADLLTVHVKSIVNYEAKNGKDAKVPYDRLGEIADVTGVSLKWLLHGDDEEADLATRLDDFDKRLAAVAEQQDKVLDRLSSLGEQQGMLTDVERELLAEISATLNRLGRDVGLGRPQQRSGPKIPPAATRPAA